MVRNLNTCSKYITSDKKLIKTGQPSVEKNHDVYIPAFEYEYSPVQIPDTNTQRITRNCHLELYVNSQKGIY